MLCRTNSRPPSGFSPIAGRVFPSSQRHGGDPLRGHEREEPIGQARVDRDVREAHRHRVLELIVHDRLPDLPRRRVHDQDEARERRQRLLRGEVEHPVAVGVLWPGRVQEADAELGAQAPEAREEAARRSRQGLGRVAHVDLVQRGRVDPELLAVGDDLLRRRLLVLPAELAALLEIDRALRRDRLIEALVERRLGELGAEVDHAAVRALEVADDVVQRRRRPRGRSRRDEARDDKGTREAVGAALDRVRDEWIAHDETGWLASHAFYRGVIERLRRLAGGPVRVVVVTTKEGRFVRTLLARQGLTLGDADVYGKEARRPKRTILLELVAGRDATRVWFVEDRLRTLEDVKREPALAGARLFLAAWGYNTADDRATARNDGRIVLLTLARFARTFSAWVTY